MLSNGVIFLEVDAFYMLTDSDGKLAFFLAHIEFFARTFQQMENTGSRTVNKLFDTVSIGAIRVGEYITTILVV